jgi:hypothetical protein
MGRACSNVGREVYIEFWWGNLLKGLGLDGRIILKWIFMKWDWIELAQTRKECWALVNAVMNFRVP